MEPQSIVFQGDGENKRWMRENDQSRKLLHITWCVQILRSPNLFKKNYSSQEAENAVTSQRNHPVDVHIFHNAHATIAWPQQTLFRGSFWPLENRCCKSGTTWKCATTKSVLQCWKQPKIARCEVRWVRSMRNKLLSSKNWTRAARWGGALSWWKSTAAAF